MKQRFYAPILALLATLLAVPGVTAQPIDSIVAVVNQDVILSSELAAAVEQARRRLGARAESIPSDTLRSNVLDELITTQLQLQRAREMGLSVSDTEIARGVARIAQRNNMSVKRFKRALEARGIPLASIKQRVRENLLIRKVRRRAVLQEVEVTRKDVTQFLESRSLRNKNNREYHIRHIRIDLPAAASEVDVQKARQLASRIRTRALAGEATFAQLAKTYSDGDNAARGGDMGWVGNAFMPRMFTDVVPGLEPGGISRVFRGAGAFHLVKLIGSRGTQSLAGGQKVMVEQVKLRHIVLKPNALRNAKRTRELAMEIRERLAAGADFADLARQYSDDKTTASQGGSLGWMQPRQLGPRKAEQVAEMQPGDVSPVIEIDSGYVIVKVVDRRTVDKTREAIRRRARQIIGRRKAQEKGRRWLHKLRAQAYIEIRLKGYQRGSG